MALVADLAASMIDRRRERTSHSHGGGLIVQRLLVDDYHAGKDHELGGGVWKVVDAVSFAYYFIMPLVEFVGIDLGKGAAGAIPILLRRLVARG